MGWSAVCDCGISLSYSRFYCLQHPVHAGTNLFLEKVIIWKQRLHQRKESVECASFLGHLILHFMDCK